MYEQGRANVTVAEIESIVSICIRGLEGADQTTRRSFAELVAYIFMLTQTEVDPISVDTSTSRKSNKKDNEGAEDDGTDVRTAPEVPTATLMTVPEMLNVLSAWIVRPTTTRRMRVGVTEIYAKLFITMGPAFVEAQYPQIAGHLLNEIVAHPRSGVSRQDVLLTRRLISILLRDVIGVRMLSEQGQISAIRELSNAYLRKWPALMPGQVAPSSKILVVVLNEIAGLLQQLGNAPPPVQARPIFVKTPLFF